VRLQTKRHIAGACLFLAAAVAISLAETKPQQNPARSKSRKQEAPFTFQVPVNVVVVNATVIDRQGNPVKDLAVNDFKVYDDGKPQTIHTFSLESYQTTLETQQSGFPAPGIVPAAPRAAPASRPRYLCFFLDDLIYPSIELYHPALEAIRTFVSHDLQPGHQVAMMAASGLASYPFSGDVATLLSRVAEMEKKLNHRPLNLPTCPELSDLQAIRIINQMGRIAPGSSEYSDDDAIRVAVVEMLSCDTEVRMIYEAQGRAAAVAEARSRLPGIALRYTQEKEYCIGLLLNSLRQFIASLRFYDGNKSLILLSGGYYSPETQYSLQEVIDKALRSGVTVNALDVRGVNTSNISAADNSFVDHTTIAQKVTFHSASLQAHGEPLAQLAEDTGGVFSHGNNDLHVGLKTIAEREACNYVLSYALPNMRNDGRYHKIKLEVNRPGVQISYRQGYYAPKEEVSFVRRNKEDILEALRAPGDINSIPVRLSYSSFRLDDSHYQLSIQVQIDIRSVRFAEEEARHDNLIHIVAVASDENGRVVDGLERAIDFKLTDASYRKMLRYGLSSQAEINVPPGRYKLQAVVRESNQARMGSQSKLIEVP